MPSIASPATLPTAMPPITPAVSGVVLVGLDALNGADVLELETGAVAEGIGSAVAADVALELQKDENSALVLSTATRF